MSKTNWNGGRKAFDMGPCKLYIKPIENGSWQDDSGWIDTERSESLTLRDITEYADLVSMQTGSRAADKVITGQGAEVETNLGEAYIELLEQLSLDIRLVKSGENTVGAMRVKQQGRRISSKLLWCKVVKIIGDAESTDPMDTRYFLASPMSETAEYLFDTDTQRWYALMLYVFENSASYVTDTLDLVSDEDGNPAYWWVGEVN
jgi:hypothetical protein